MLSLQMQLRCSYSPLLIMLVSLIFIASGTETFIKRVGETVQLECVKENNTKIVWDSDAGAISIDNTVQVGVPVLGPSQGPV